MNAEFNNSDRGQKELDTSRYLSC